MFYFKFVLTFIELFIFEIAKKKKAFQKLLNADLSKLRNTICSKYQFEQTDRYLQSADMTKL